MDTKDRSDSSASRSPAPPTPTSWIEKTPGVCGGDACIRRTRITVAGLVEWRDMGLSSTQILEQHPDLTAADLEVAWDYYEKNSEEIDQAIRENAEA